MKLRRLNEPYWIVPLEEVQRDMRRMLRVQWREFIHLLDEADEVDNKLQRSCQPVLLHHYKKAA